MLRPSIEITEIAEYAPAKKTRGQGNPGPQNHAAAAYDAGRFPGERHPVALSELPMSLSAGGPDVARPSEHRAPLYPQPLGNSTGGPLPGLWSAGV